MKPENLLFTNASMKEVRLADFGSAVFSKDQALSYVASRFYRAPEIILRITPYTPKVDIWAFGCILAELLSGQPLFPGSSEQVQLELIMEICGNIPTSMIEKSPQKDVYFDTDGSPFLTEEEDQGILRIPDSKSLEDALGGEALGSETP